MELESPHFGLLASLCLPATKAHSAKQVNPLFSSLSVGRQIAALINFAPHQLNIHIGVGASHEPCLIHKLPPSSEY